MSHKTVLCECFICKGENPELGGKFVSMSAFRRHRKKESKWSCTTNIQNLNADIINTDVNRDSENNFNVNEDHEGDEYNYERCTEQFGDDIFFQYDDKDDMVTTDKSYDSDDDGNNSYDDSDNNNDNDSVNSSSKDDEFLGSSLGNNEDEFSEDLFLNVLKLLEIKQKHNLSDRAFNEILS
ncbi:hypothetical protein RCL_jg4195.t1 [Rhizophagus clarus]|uniref:Uncharacterized protein n=1 Tax=Rhizophagus clarus TaxID=94130 RepID=A0A8H3QBM1_9GLOM|nr:hypothetical protein RCL_jg4195.t1 [Rhizophagus clarus]